MTATTTRKQAKGTTKRVTVGGAALTPKQRKVAAVDAYQQAEAKAKAASEAKGIARDNVLAVAKNNDIIEASDGTKYLVVDTPNVPTKQHAKVVAKLVAQYGVSQKELTALYEATAGTSHPREVKKI